MLQRVFIHLSLILLFTFTQMGVATHEISHLADSQEQDQQDQNSTESQCEPCLSYSHAAVADLAPLFTFSVTPVEHVFTASAFTSTSSASPSFYSARAPPTTLQN